MELREDKPLCDDNNTNIQKDFPTSQLKGKLLKIVGGLCAFSATLLDRHQHKLYTNTGRLRATLSAQPLEISCTVYHLSPSRGLSEEGYQSEQKPDSLCGDCLSGLQLWRM